MTCWNAFELFEHVLDELYVKRSEKMRKLAASINKRKGSVRKEARDTAALLAGLCSCFPWPTQSLQICDMVRLHTKPVTLPFDMIQVEAKIHHRRPNRTEDNGPVTALRFVNVQAE